MNDEMTDLEHIRERPSMYVGCTSTRGLHHIVDELLDNSIDQFLAQNVTTVRVKASNSVVEFEDDGPGLPFDQPHETAQTLATSYLTEVRRDSPTADGHTPHVHLGGFGCGLFVVTALTETCTVESWRADELWTQSFSRGVALGPAKTIPDENGRGTKFRISVDREIFDADFSPELIEQRLESAAYLFPGLVLETPTNNFRADRGLADMSAKVATESGASDPNRTWWINELFGDIHIHAAIAGTTEGETSFSAFANGREIVENGTHTEALQLALSDCGLKPAVASIHVIMQNPQFSGPTRSKLDVPEIFQPIYDALKPSLEKFVEEF